MAAYAELSKFLHEWAVFGPIDGSIDPYTRRWPVIAGEPLLASE